MLRVTSLTSMDERQLNRWIRRLALLLAVGAVLFTAFYVLDRWKPATTPIVDRQVAALEEAVRNDPDDVVARGLLADTYVLKGRYEDAIVQYDAILATGKETTLATYGRATASQRLGRLDEAATDYLAVVELQKGGEMAHVDPLLQKTYYQLGAIAMAQGRPAEAIPFLEKALAIKRSDADAMYLVGTAFVATGETEKAVTAFRGAVAFDPIGWKEPYAALADLYAKAGRTALAEWAGAMVDSAEGRTAEARTRLLAIADGEAGLDATIGLGYIAEASGDTAEAAEWYGKALAIAPDSTAARMGMSRVTAGDAASPLPPLPTPGAPGGATD